MLNCRFVPYIVGACIVTLLSISYIGYRAYQNHVEFQAFISESEGFQGAFDTDASRMNQNSEGHAREILENGVSDLLDQPPVKVRYAEASKIGESSSEVYSVLRGESQPLVPQLVETPEGTVRVVYTTPDKMLKDGDAIPPPPPPLIPENNILENPMEGWNTIEPSEIPDHIPEAERDAYVEKLIDAKSMGISIEELERQLASGELKIESAPLTPEDEKMIQALVEGYLINHGKQTPSGEGEYQLQISDATAPVSAGKRGGGSARSEASPITDAPASPINATHVHTEGEHTHTPLTTESIEAELTEGLSLERFDKAQQLIDQYGSEEGLRRLRESDPEAARQFEREQRTPPVRSEPDAPDDGQAER